MDKSLTAPVSYKSNHAAAARLLSTLVDTSDPPLNYSQGDVFFYKNKNMKIILSVYYK